MAADISDSESIVSIGELGDDARLKVDGDDKDSVPDENMNNWEVRVSSIRFLSNTLTYFLCLFS